MGGLTQSSRWHRATKHHLRKETNKRRQQWHEQYRQEQQQRENERQPRISTVIINEETAGDVNDDEKEHAAELRRFLFMGDNNDNNGGDDDGDDCAVVSMNKFDAIWYTLNLEPTEVQNERCIMIFECFSIFGALLIAVMWVVYEYRYAASSEDDVETPLDRVFDGIASLALTSNIFLTVFGSWFWGTTILTNAGQQSFLWGCRGPILYLTLLMLFTTFLIVIETILGLWI